MIIDGTTFKVKDNYRPLTELALSWHQLSSMNWYSIDRSNQEDLYQAKIDMLGGI